MEQLSELLDPADPEKPGNYDLKRQSYSIVREQAFAYESGPENRQGEFTLEDYYAFPEDQRVELIDGVIYDMGAPTSVHQIIAGDIHAQILRCVEAHGIPCMPAISPIDVQLDRDERTMVQPDVAVCFDPGLTTVRNIYGAPEFVVEVVSPSSRRRDQFLKLYKYENAGCMEYWIVDPDNQKVVVYYFPDEHNPTVYGFDDEVPIRVSRGLCSIDFPHIRERLAMIAEEEDPAEMERRKEWYREWMRLLKEEE